MTPTTPMYPASAAANKAMPHSASVSVSLASYSANKASPMTVSTRMEQWGQERDESFKRGLARLREEIVQANVLVREANFLVADKGAAAVRFAVTLQIPPQNLTPNRKVRIFKLMH